MLQPSERSIAALIGFETGGRSYYELRLARPSWPGGMSGVTVGVGYDLGYRTPATVASNWARLGSAAALDLAAVAGVKGTQAQRAVRELHGIIVPWEMALEVFRTVTLPEWIEKTAQAFPGAELLHPDVQGALVSLAYNRGTGMTGESRREMRAVRAAVARGDVPEIARQIRRMQRLWVGKGMDGIIRRRNDEAKLVEQAGGGIDRG